MDKLIPNSSSKEKQRTSIFKKRLLQLEDLKGYTEEHTFFISFSKGKSIRIYPLSVIFVEYVFTQDLQS